MSFKPFVNASAQMKEFTPGSILMGIVLGIVFGASSLYLALKVGMTVSASIPIAVLSITLFKGFSKVFGLRRTTILENNIVQTTGSAGESIAFGVAVTMPALLILGHEMELSRIMLVATLGGVLGVLMMIPLRQALIVKEHGKLAYPEGTACAEVLIVGEKGGTTAKTVFTGFFIGLAYKFFSVGMKLWKDVPEKAFSFFKGSSIGAEASPELLGVGYIIGPRTASIMMAGGVLSSWVLIPMIYLFGESLTTPIFPSAKIISQMSAGEIWRNYVLYIGAGAVAAGGIISLFQSLPTIVRGAMGGLQSLKASRAGGAPAGNRTSQDLPMSVVLVGSLILVAIISLVPGFHMNILGAILIILFGFLFVTVSSRLTGQIGSSSNPISGMTVATLLLTCLIFLALGWTDFEFRVTALSIAAIVCVAASNGGTTSQDLKTGFLVGGTPKYQQLGLLAGVITSGLVIGYTLNLLNDASTVYTKRDLPPVRIDVSNLTEKERVLGPEAAQDSSEYYVLRVREQSSDPILGQMKLGKYLVDGSGTIQYFVDPGINGSYNTRDDGTPVQKYEAPKARLMSLIIDGILTQKLPWGLVLLGVSIAVLMELCGVASLPFAVGVYLPFVVSVPVFIGGMIRWAADKLTGAVESAETETSPGVLLSSGLIAGGAIGGILLAIFSLKEGWTKAIALHHPLSESDGLGALVFAGLVLYTLLVGAKKVLRS